MPQQPALRAVKCDAEQIRMISEQRKSIRRARSAGLAHADLPFLLKPFRKAAVARPSLQVHSYIGVTLVERRCRTMPVQFLDSRVSDFFTSDNEDLILPTDTPILLGDIGLQTAAALGTPNQSSIRVQLVGTIGVTIRSGNPRVIVYVQRGGTEVFGSGTIIYTLQGDLPAEAGNTRLLNFTAGDFPSALDAASGEIRYTMFAVAERSRKSRVRISGPVNFMGTAAAGNE